MLITLTEIFYLLVTTAVIGYIFNDMVRVRRTAVGLYFKRFSWSDFYFACLIAAPGIIFHELSHKFLALAFGLSAQFYIFPFGMALGIILKLVGSPFILLAPGYVSIGGTPTTLQNTLISFAGPFINLLLWIIPSIILKVSKLKKKTMIALFFTKQINMWLFVFNMLPIPPLDGSKVFYGIFKLILQR